MYVLELHLVTEFKTWISKQQGMFVCRLWSDCLALWWIYKLPEKEGSVSVQAHTTNLAGERWEQSLSPVGDTVQQPKLSNEPASGNTGLLQLQ